MKEQDKKIARLIKQIQCGNQSAFEEFYKLTSPKAYFIALKITQNEHDAEDILQESYIKALEKIAEIDASQNVTSWFLKIVSNKSKDLLKSKNRIVFESEEETIFEEIPEEKTEFCPEENLNQEELRLEVMAAIDELTAEKRACIMMMYFGDMSVKEIAESIEVPETTVKNRLYTARKELKTKFEKNGNIFYGAALGGVLAWTLNKTSVTASAAFLASAASAEIVAGATAAYTAGATATAATATTAVASTASTTTATTAASTAAATTAAAATTGAAASTAAATGAGVAAKIAALSIAQKVVVGTVAAGVIGGSTAGVATVAKNISLPDDTTTSYIVEEVTTAPSQTKKFLFAWLDNKDGETDKQTESSTQITTEATTLKREPTATFPEETEREDEEKETEAEETETEFETESDPESEAEIERGSTIKPTAKATTTRRDYSLNRTTSKIHTTTKKVTTTKTTTTQKPTTTKVVTTTNKVTTTAVETTANPTTTVPPTTTQAPTTTQPPTTAEPTTQAPATLIIEVTDFDNNVVATITETVEAGTEITRSYLVSLVSSKGYEAMAGVYGDAIGKVAEVGQTYTFTAEL